MALPTDKQERKDIPIATGFIDYFPDALAGVAHLSKVGNDQHNPGEPLHWAKGKSNDHPDCLMRHFIQRGTVDDDGVPHSAKVAWRAFAIYQLEIEASRGPSLLDIETDKLEALEAEAFEIDSATHPPYHKPYTCYYPSASGEFIYIPNCDAGNEACIEARLNVFDDLREAACPEEIAGFITGGVTLPAVGCLLNQRNKRVYIAGPMRGIKKYNFPAFDRAVLYMRDMGYLVISPADIDRATKNIPKETDISPEMSRMFAFRDFHALHILEGEQGDAIAMLPGWEKSTGATAEFLMARWLGLKILDAETGKKLININWSILMSSVRGYLSKENLID